MPQTVPLQGKRLVVRVDWNVSLPLGDIQKIRQSLPFIQTLSARGVKVVILTHLGRPVGIDASLSTRPLVELAARMLGQPIQFHDEDQMAAARTITQSAAGSIHVMENVRFEKGETENTAAAIKKWASLGDVFVNNAFASCHDAHASVTGIAKVLPSFAGPDLEAEVAGLAPLLRQPPAPFIAFVGGIKWSTKLPLVKALLHTCDAVYLGSGLAAALAATTSGVDAGVRSISTHKKLHLPGDITLDQGRAADVGPATLKTWERAIADARTMIWNGPMGEVEKTAFAKGTHGLIRLIVTKRAPDAYAVAGGGDTVPVIAELKATKAFNHVSMGGGAMLAFLAQKGKLPGLVPLYV